MIPILYEFKLFINQYTTKINIFSHISSHKSLVCSLVLLYIPFLTQVCYLTYQYRDTDDQ